MYKNSRIKSANDLIRVSLRKTMEKVSTAYILWVVFGVYYFYLGHPVKNILLWILCGCFIGIIWWIIDLFRISGMVKRKNQEILKICIEEAQQLYPSPVPPVHFEK